MYSPTIEDIIRPYTGYPKTIQQAIVLVETNPRFLGLTRSMKSVLKTLLTRASQFNGTTQIKARLDTVAMQAEVSTKTVERTMKVLHDAEWITTMSEGRSEWGVFESKRYAFTESLCEIVGLPTGKKKPAQEPKTEMSDGAVYVDLNFKEDYSKILEEKRKANPEATPINLPTELEEIVSLGVKPSGVCKLRGIASDHGYRLEDIYVVAKKYLARAKCSGQRVYRYLLSLIGKQSDYAARASQIERLGATPEEGKESSLAGGAMSRSKKYAHKRFSVSPGKYIRIFDGLAEVVRDGQWVKNIAGKDMETVYDDIDAGRIVEIKD
ncbi:hypothetical protein AAKU58_004141 [Oxalobacteraceae bacterium GrIS 1.18]